MVRRISADPTRVKEARLMRRVRRSRQGGGAGECWTRALVVATATAACCALWICGPDAARAQVATSVSQAQEGRMATANVPAAVSGAGINAGVQLPRVSGFAVMQGLQPVPMQPGPVGPVPRGMMVIPDGQFGFGMWVMDPVVVDGVQVGEVPAHGGWGMGMGMWGGRGFGGFAPRPAGAGAGEMAPARSRERERDQEKAAQLAVLGDRFFRAGNMPRAVQRYEQALRADPFDAATRVRLSQVELKRGDFAGAAGWLREAQMADPGWVVERPFDVQTLYPEPVEFSSRLSEVEAHLQAHPEDRDAWLVLGAMLYLSGRVQPAADVFLRLSDRRPDSTLAAFLEAVEGEP